jgi:hypothetical protein
MPEEVVEGEGVARLGAEIAGSPIVEDDGVGGGVVEEGVEVSGGDEGIGDLALTKLEAGGEVGEEGTGFEVGGTGGVKGGGGEGIGNDAGEGVEVEGIAIFEEAEANAQILELESGAEGLGCGGGGTPKEDGVDAPRSIDFALEQGEGYEEGAHGSLSGTEAELAEA